MKKVSIETKRALKANQREAYEILKSINNSFKRMERAQNRLNKIHF